MRIVLIFASLVSVRCEFWLQILHTNDLHARFDETDVYSGSCSPQFSRAKKCFGGFARLKTAIDVATQEARSKHIPTINLNVGDTFDGTPSYTTYKWKIVTEFVDRMGFDAMTLGNHEFVDGAEDLASFLKNSRTPVVCSNLNISVDRRLDLPNLRPSLVISIGDTKIGIVGYLTPHIMHLADHKGLVLPEIPSVRAEARNLKSQGVEIIIALGHSGFYMDKKVAAEVEEISLVVGAHSHTFLYTPMNERPSTEIPLSEYPTMVVQKSGKKVPVVQAYAYSKYLGKLLARFDDNGNVIEASGNPQLLDGGIEKDPQLDKDISAWMNVIRQRYGAVQGYTRVSLLRPNFLLGRFQSTWGNILTDAILDQAVIDAKRKSLSTWSRSTVVLQPESGIRINIDRDKNDGGVTLEDVSIALPFNEELVELAVYGSTIRKLLEYSVWRYDRRRGMYDLSNFLFFSGMQVKYDLSRAHDTRVVSARVLCSDCEVPEFRPLIDNEVYYLITTTYLTHEGSSYVTRTEYINKTMLGYKNTDVFIRYLRKNDIVYPKNDERITVVGFQSPFYSSSVMTKVSIFILIFSQLIHSIVSS